MTGVLLIQLGTPDEPTTPALRRYLRQFLADPRVSETPTAWQRLRWRLVLNLFILPTRPAQSAAKYRRIWDAKTGSPLLHITRLQTAALQRLLPDVPVRFGMQVGNPSVADVLREMIGQGVERLIVPPYYNHPAYLGAVTAVIREELARVPWQPEHYLLSFHGIPIQYARRGDPYATHVKRTTARLIERLGWPRDRWTQSFQSLFGKDEWLKPYTDRVLERLAKRGVRRVFVATPGFTTDCLETLDEIGNESRELFRHAGGEELHLCPCLNAHPAWVGAMRALVLEEGQGWLKAAGSPAAAR